MGVSRRRVSWTGAIAVALLLLTAVHNWAQNELSVSFHAFQDSRGVTVLSPDSSLNKDFSDRTQLKVRFGVDAISAASDSCARCHSEGASNARVVLGASVVRKYGDTKVTFGGELSGEQFYQATTGLVSVARDLNKGNTTVAGGFAFALNRPQLHPSKETESQHSVDAYGSVTQSWTKSTVTQVGYELNQVNGFQSNPFLRTPVNGIMTVGNSPDARTRHAISARIRQALPAATFLEADYRRYHDSWALDSNALSAGLTHRFSSTLLAGASYRRYTQTGVFFYEPAYTGTPEFFTGDFRLFPFNSSLWNGHVEVTPKHGIFNMPAGTTLTLQYERYRATTGFEAGIFTGGVRIPLK